MNNKSPKMENLLEQMALASYGRSRKDPACIQCGSEKIEAKDFTDDLSRTEFSISRLCQVCQDKIFDEVEV